MARYFQRGDLIAERYLVFDVKMGGLAIVYLCIDLQQTRTVALKTLQERYVTDENRLEAFKKDPLVWMRLEKHPNIVQFLDFNLIDAQPYLFLECVTEDNQDVVSGIVLGVQGKELGEEAAAELPTAASRGVSLHDWITASAVDQRLAWDFAIDICRGMLHANQCFPGGIVHRDLKPENILIAPGPVAKISDFDLARPVEPSSADETDAVQSDPDAGRGTPFYMSPEQWRLEMLDTRSDIYAFGCVLYELFSGTRLFDSTNPHELHDLHLARPYEPSPTLPAAINDIIARCLLKTRTDRYPTFETLLTSLIDAYQAQFGAAPRQAAQREQFGLHDYVTRAIAYFRLNRFDDSYSDLTQALTIAANDADLYSYRGCVNSFRGKHEEAAADFERAVDLAPDSMQVHYLRGVALRHAEQYEGAYQSFTRALELGSTGPDLYVQRGIVLTSLKRFEDALQDFTQALQATPAGEKPDSDIYYFRGRAYFLLDRTESALADLNRKIDEAPEDPEAYLERGKVYYFDRRDYPAPLRDFEQARRFRPKAPAYQMWRGHALRALHKHDEALRDYNEAVRLGSRHVEVFRSRGLILARMRRLDEALKNFESALQCDPSDAETLRYQAQALVVLGRFDEAEADLNRAIALNPGDAQNWLVRAGFWRSRKRYQQAQIDCQQALMLAPDDADIYFEMGCLFNDWERHREAINWFTQAIGRNIRFSAAYNNRGTAHIREDNLTQAQADFSNAVQFNPLNLTAIVNLGVLMTFRKNWPMALNYFTQAAKCGSPTAADQANAINQQFGLPPLPDPRFSILESAANARDLEAMRRVALQFPYVSESEFWEWLAQTPASSRPPLSAEQQQQLMVAAGELTT